MKFSDEKLFFRNGITYLIYKTIDVNNLIYSHYTSLQTFKVVSLAMLKKEI